MAAKPGKSPKIEQQSLLVADAKAWRTWLDENEDVVHGVWLFLAKKGMPSPTTLTYAEALDEALCSGWIDGQVRKHDESMYLQRFTPRRARSMWSVRNTEHIARLESEGRMRERGRAEVERAKADGRWERAYEGPAKIQVPDDLAAALKANPKAAKVFAALKGQNRYAVLHRVVTASTPATRRRRIDALVEKLSAGETPYQQ
jgi:uncharacterized protein YdeI (YjbR/CyaY-like superfamily)